MPASLSDIGASALLLRRNPEREIKLSIPSDFRIPGSLGARLPARTFKSTYVDTPDHVLASHGVTLRRRVEHRRGVWQLKLPAGESRLELELDGPATTPPQSLTDLLFLHLRGKALQPVVTLWTRRAGVRVCDGGGSVADIVVDTVRAEADGRSMGILRECEIELAEGDPSFLTQLEATLRQVGAGDHDGRPKVCRVLGIEPCAVGAPLLVDAPLTQHVSVFLSALVETLTRWDPFVRLGVDPESLHQMRVAVRRLRAVLRTLRPLLSGEQAEPLRAELAWLGGVLGQVRDLDVQIDYFQQEVRGLDPCDRPPVRRLLRALTGDRTRAQQDLVGQLRSDRYLTVVDRLRLFSSSPPFVETTLSVRDLAVKEFKRLRRSVRMLSAQTTDAELHQIRIRAKRARYAAELAAAVVGKPAWRFIDAVKELQDVLGNHQDAVVAEKRVRAFLERAQGVHAAFAAGRMVERQQRRKAEAREHWPELWKKVLKRGKKVWT